MRRPKPRLSAYGAGGLTIRLEHVDLVRGGRRVLHDVSWTIRPGERWVVEGPNGAGKTQLLKILSGTVWPTPSRRGRRCYQIGAEWHESPLAVRDEIIYVGAERQDRYERYGWNFSALAVVGTGIHRTDTPLDPLTPRDRRVALALLRRFGIAGLARRRFLSLSYGERRLVLIARALASRPRLLVLDEVANGLDAARQRTLQQWFHASRRSRLTWVLATHHSSEIPAAATHALRLEAGRVVSRGKLNRSRGRSRGRERLESPKSPLIAQTRASCAARSIPGPPLVELAGANVFLDQARVLRRISLAVRSGECWVVHGPNGSGKTTLLRTIYGDHAVASGGRIVRLGVSPGVPLEDFKRWVGFVAPHLQSDHPRGLSVIEAVASGRYASIGLNAPLTRADARAARLALRWFALTDLAHRPLLELSYGQMRRVLFARAWINSPRLLLLDEPFAGLDVKTRRELSRRVDDFVAAGGACIMTTHTRAEWPRAVTHELAL